MSKNSKTVVAKPVAKKTATKAAKAPAKKTEAKAAPEKKAEPKAAKPAAKVAKPVAETPKAEVKPAKAPAKKVAEKPAKVAAPKKVAVEFVADCPLATTVSIAGSFNNWTVDVDMLKKDKKTGLWVAKISLVPGDYEYKFVCDGKNWDAGDNKIKHV
jgi:hypothetical protein